MKRQTNQPAQMALTIGVALLSVSNVAAQFNPYVMPRFNPVGPANPVLAPTTVSAPISPSVLGAYNPYFPTPYNPYFYPGRWGGTLMGLAEVYRSYGTLIMNMEQARSMREQAIQAKLDTQRKRFELDSYLKANTPSFTEEQSKVARITLKRIHGNSLPAEITSGKALNLMLDDARKFPSRKVAMEKVVLGEDLLSHLNVTASHVGLGLLRDGGRINWSLAVKETVPAAQLKLLEQQAQKLVQGALKGDIDVDVFRDFGTELDRTLDNLIKRVNEVAGPQYLDAKRFLGELKDARTALEKGEAERHVRFQKFIAGGKSVQDVVDFMIGNGWRFGPAIEQDEAAYRAFYAALVVFDVALNSQGPSAIGDGKENR